MSDILSQSLTLTDSAMSRIANVMSANEELGTKFRVYVTGGGCSGFEYGFTFDEDLEEDDTAIEQSGIRLVIDPLSYQYLAGAEVDFREDLQGSRFVVNNPNASVTCGCGNSFAIA